MRRALLAVSLGIAALSSGGARVLHAQVPANGVRAGTSIDADTVRVGDPFHLKVRVRAPVGATITFPEPPDTAAGAVQGLDPKIVARSNDSSAMDETATYRLAAWDIGAQPITLGDIVVKTAAGEQRVPVGRISVFVRSVLPADSTKRVPRPARPIVRFPQPMWWLWALLAAAAILLSLGIWWWRRRKRAERSARPALDPYEFAQREFERIERLGLVEAGERGRFVSVAAEVVRQYLSMRYADGSLALTSQELIRALARERAVPLERLGHFLDEVDLVKFAKRPVSAERARDLAKEARGIVTEEHERSQPVPDETPAERAA